MGAHSRQKTAFSRLKRTDLAQPIKQPDALHQVGGQRAEAVPIAEPLQGLGERARPQRSVQASLEVGGQVVEEMRQANRLQRRLALKEFLEAEWLLGCQIGEDRSFVLG